MLPVLTKFSDGDGSLSPEDIAAVSSLGVSDEAITDAFYVAYLFNIINRMAHALCFEISTQAELTSRRSRCSGAATGRPPAALSPAGSPRWTARRRRPPA